MKGNIASDCDDLIHLQHCTDFLGSCSETIDLTSAVPNDSPQTEPEHICQETSGDFSEQDESDTVEWDLEDDLGRAHGDRCRHNTELCQR